MKHWLKSKTIWGVIVCVLPTLAPLVGLGNDDLTMISHVGDSVIQAVGALLAVYGRVKAEDKLSV